MISDEQLMIQIKYGEKSALDTLVRRYHGSIHAYIVRMGLEHHTAGDLVQEVFIKLLRNVKAYEPERPFKPWLYTIASNTYKDYLKKAYVQKDIVTAEFEDNTKNADSPEDIFLLQQEKERVAASLGLLSEIHREVLILRYYQDLKLNEIAAILKLPLGTVKSRLSNALHHLKKLLVEGTMKHDHQAG